MIGRFGAKVGEPEVPGGRCFDFEPFFLARLVKGSVEAKLGKFHLSLISKVIIEYDIHITYYIGTS